MQRNPRKNDDISREFVLPARYVSFSLVFSKWMLRQKSNGEGEIWNGTESSGGERKKARNWVSALNSS